MMLLLLIAIPTTAQEQPERVEFKEINTQLLNCETNLLLQDIVVSAALQQTKQNGVLIVIARSGSGEDSRELMRRRIYNVRQYFKERGRRLAPEKVVIAEGERVKGNGRLEYYLGGKLLQQLLFPRNHFICHSCCGPDEGYYPEKEDYESQKNQNQKRKRRG
jgi:hypothetical protein